MMRLSLAAAAAAHSLVLLPRRLARPIRRRARRHPNSDTYRQLDLFGEVFERVRADYVEQVTDEQLIEARDQRHADARSIRIRAI